MTETSTGKARANLNTDGSPARLGITRRGEVGIRDSGSTGLALLLGAKTTQVFKSGEERARSEDGDHVGNARH